MNIRVFKQLISFGIKLVILALLVNTPLQAFNGSKAAKKSITKASKFRFYTCDSFSRKTLNKKAKRFSKYIDRAAKETKVSPALIKAIITAESCFRPTAKSNKGAVGLMQLMPATAKRFGVTNRYNNSRNIKAGSRYLKFLLKHFKGDLRKTIAAYNAGEGAVRRHNGIPPYKETRTYVKRVLNAYYKMSGKKKRSMERKRKRSKKGRKQNKGSNNRTLPKKLKPPQPVKVRFVDIKRERLDLAAVRQLVHIRR